MIKAVVFGLLVAVTVIGLSDFAPQPFGGLTLGLFSGGVLLTCAILVWRRLGLALTAAAYLFGAVNACVIGWLIGKYGGLSQIPLLGHVPSLSTCLLMYLLINRDRREKPEIHRQWKSRFEQASLLDVLRFRHIPRISNPA